MIATGWALNTAYDFAADAITYRTHLSNDDPNISKSLTVGGVAGLAGLFALPLTTLGGGMGAKVVVGTYNAVLSGTAAAGGNAIANPSSDPSPYAATGTLATGAGTVAQSVLPTRIGDIANHIIQVLSGPTQTAVQNAEKK